MSREEIKQLLERAIKAGKKRNYEEAISLLTQIVNNYDYPAKALLYLGRSYHAIGDFNKAIPILEFFLKTNPDSLAGHFFLGRTYLVLELFRQAAFHLKIVLEDSNSPFYFPALNLGAVAFLKAKKPELAVTYFETALKIEPDNRNVFNGYLNALLVKAIKLFRNNNLAESAQIFEFLVKNRDESILPHLYLGSIYRISGNNDKALFHYDAALEISPDDPVLKLQKAVTLLKSGKIKDAEAELEHLSYHLKEGSAKRADPYQLLRFITMTHFKNKEYAKAIHYGKEILKENYADIEIHVVIAESYLKLGDLEKAKNHYLRCIERDKNSLDLYYGLFNVLWEKNEYEELLAKVRRVLHINQHDDVAQYFYALCYSRIGESPEQVLVLLQNQIRKKGPDPLLMTALGRAYLIYEMPDLAENWLLRTLKVKPEDKRTLLLIMHMYGSLDQPEKQKDYVNKYLALYPEDHSVRGDYVKILFRLKMYKQTIQEIRILLPLMSKKNHLQKMLAFSYTKIRNYKEAILIYKELLQDTPDNIDYLRSLVTCLEKNGNKQYALNLAEKAAQYFKRSAKILFLLGNIYYRNGDLERAVNAFKEILSEEPHNWVAYHNIGAIYRKKGNMIFADKFLKRAQEFKKKAEG